VSCYKDFTGGSVSGKTRKNQEEVKKKVLQWLHTSGVLLVCYLLLAWVDWRLLARRLPVRARQKQFSAREQEQQEQAKQRKWEWEMKHDERGPPRIAWCSAQQQQQAAADRTHTAAAAAAASAAAAAAAGQVHCHALTGSQWLQFGK
jgi:hypothetical protein